MIDYKKLIESLRSISEICLDIEDCDDCPCSSDDGVCLLLETSPYMWNIVEPEKVVKVMR